MHPPLPNIRTTRFNIKAGQIISLQDFLRGLKRPVTAVNPTRNVNNAISITTAFNELPEGGDDIHATVHNSIQGQESAPAGSNTPGSMLIPEESRERACNKIRNSHLMDLPESSPQEDQEESQNDSDSVVDGLGIQFTPKPSTQGRLRSSKGPVINRTYSRRGKRTHRPLQMVHREDSDLLPFVDPATPPSRSRDQVGIEPPLSRHCSISTEPYEGGNTSQGETLDNEQHDRVGSVNTVIRKSELETEPGSEVIANLPSQTEGISYATQNVKSKKRTKRRAPTKQLALVRELPISTNYIKTSKVLISVHIYHGSYRRKWSLYANDGI